MFAKKKNSLMIIIKMKILPHITILDVDLGLVRNMKKNTLLLRMYTLINRESLVLQIVCLCIKISYMKIRLTEELTVWILDQRLEIEHLSKNILAAKLKTEMDMLTI